MKIRLWLLLGLAACSGVEQEKPDEFDRELDMEILALKYSAPSRALDSATAAEIEMKVESKVRALFDLNALSDELTNVLAAVQDDMSSSRRVPVELYGEGYARIERICSGHGDPSPPVDKAANGFIDLTVGYDQDGLDPYIFGGATTCAEQIGSKRLSINGQIGLYIGNVLRLGDLPTVPVLFQLKDFAFSVNDTELVSGGFDFQVCRGTTSSCKAGFVEMLLELPSGGRIVFFIDPATRSGGFRANNGIWTCAFSEGRCENEQGEVVTTPVFDL